MANPYVRYWDVDSVSKTVTKTWKVSQRADGTFACECPKWKFHRAPKVDCHHIEYVICQLLGTQYIPAKKPSPTGRLSQNLPALQNITPAGRGVSTGVRIAPPRPAQTIMAPPPELIRNPILNAPIRRFRFEEDE